jgi:hypothetical protein
LNVVQKISENVTHLKSDNASLKSQLNNFKKQLIFVHGNQDPSLRDYCPAESIHRKTKKLAENIKAVPQQKTMLDLRIALQQLRLRNLLIEGLLRTLHQVVALCPKVSAAQVDYGRIRTGIYKILILLQGAVSSLGDRQLCSYSRTSQQFMEAKGSLPCSQEASTGP